MTISVLIPVYNAAGTIETTLASVLRQTVQPDEIILLLDGCMDDTPDRIRLFKDRITLASQENHGMSFTRNRLAEIATGEILAFLDNDDLWHPKYLEVQRALMRGYPEALVAFAGHLNFTGADYVWREDPDTDRASAERLKLVDFFKRYNATTGMFGSMSFACVRKSAMNRLGLEPFQFSGADDCHLFLHVPLFGGVVLFNSPLAAYRASQGQWSANRLQVLPEAVKAFEKLEPAFQESDVKGLRQAFPAARASRRRQYAKVLMRADRSVEARHPLLISVADCHQPASVGKSLALWAASWRPPFLQPNCLS